MPNWGAVDGDNAGTPEQRRSDLALAVGGLAGAVITSVGGNTAVAALDHGWISEEASSGKWFLGFSDAAAILNAVTFRTGFVSLYGADLVWGLGKLCRGKYFEATRSILADHDFGPAGAFVALRQDEGVDAPSGRAIGGCMTSFMGLMGTHYDPFAASDCPLVVFLEDIGLSPRAFEEGLYRLLQIPGFVRRCRAVVLGSFMCTAGQGWSPEHYVSKATGCLGGQIPVFVSPDFGHGVPNMPIPLGAIATLSGGRIAWSA